MLTSIKFIFLFILCLFSIATYADTDHRVFSCSLTDRMLAPKYPDSSKSIFPKNTAIIYLACASSQIEKGQKVRSAWIAADTNQVAPDNYKISEKEMTMIADPLNGTFSHINFSLSKPENNWPTGSYYVNLYVDGELDQTIKFSIQ